MPTQSKETPSGLLETTPEIVKKTKESLSLLEKETWINLFKKASDWINNLFGTNGNNNQNSNKELTENQKTNIEQNKNFNNLKVLETRDYIINGGTFYSQSKGQIKWGWNNYHGVCSTGSFNVLRKLGLPKISENTGVDLTGDTLTQMGLKYIGEVNPKNPGQNGYEPQDGDTAVRPEFKRKSGKITQHQATYINHHWVSDTIQNKMSCYPGEPNEPNCKIYRYNG